jgi:hypothetical protein
MKDNLITWAERLEAAAQTLRRRQSEDTIRDTAIEIVEAVAAEMKLASDVGHVSTWPVGKVGDE